MTASVKTPKTPTPCVTRDGKNSKVGHGVTTTMLNVGLVEDGGSCPANCAFLPTYSGPTVVKGKCFGRSAGPLNWTQSKLKYADPMLEGAKIAELNPRQDQDMRLHVVGDYVSPEHLAGVETGLETWHSKGGNVAWAYTHNYRHPTRKIDGSLAKNQILRASVHDESDIDAAREANFTLFALVLPDFHTYRKFDFHGVEFTPCPNEVANEVDRKRKPELTANPNRITCDKCRLCLKPEINVAFSEGSHNPGKRV